MRKTIAIAAVTAVLLTMAARQACALWSLNQITPGNLTFARESFAVATRRDGALTRFTITVTQKADRSPLPSPYAKLSVGTKEDTIASVPVEGERDGAKVIYRFSVSSRALANSTFEVSVPTFPREPGKVEILGGGNIYAMKLQDFVAEKRASPPAPSSTP